MSWEYSRVHAKIWDDETFRFLSERGQRVALYLLTSSQGNGLGYFRFSPGKAAEDLRLSARAFNRAFAEVQTTMGWPFDPKRRVMLLPKYFKYNSADNPNCLKSWMKELAIIPSSPLFEEFATGEQFLPEGQRSMFREALDLYGPKRTRERSPERSEERLVEPSPEPTSEGRGEPYLDTNPNTSPNTKTKPNPTQTAPPALVELFESSFWNPYPLRSGRRLGKPEALRKWLALTEEDRTNVGIAVKHYAASPDVQNCIGIKDPHRWLRNGKAIEPWRDWLEPVAAQPSINGKDFTKGVF